jgi:hypothetical protein
VTRGVSLQTRVLVAGGEKSGSAQNVAIQETATTRFGDNFAEVTLVWGLPPLQIRGAVTYGDSACDERERRSRERLSRSASPQGVRGVARQCDRLTVIAPGTRPRPAFEQLGAVAGAHPTRATLLRRGERLRVQVSVRD